MVLVDKRAALQEIDNVPVVCNTCGQQAELQSPDDTVRDALVEASYIRSVQEEIILLHRTQTLFERFPKSRHPIRIHHLYVKQTKRLHTHSDAEFAKALADDPELKVFLTQNSFLLPARLAAITQACESWEKRLDSTAIQCAECGRGHYLIEPDLFNLLLNSSWELAHHP
jgi:hypothetical protein